MARSGSLEDRLDFIVAQAQAAFDNLETVVNDFDNVVELIDMLREEVAEGEFEREATKEYVKPSLGDRITAVWNHDSALGLRNVWSMDDFSNWCCNNQTKLAAIERDFGITDWATYSG